MGKIMPRKEIGSHIRVQGWEEIAEYFPFSSATLRRKYGQEMLDAGFLFRSKVCMEGEVKRRWVVWGWEYMIIMFQTMKQAQQGFL